MAYTVISQNNTVTTLEDELGNVVHVPAFASLSTQEYTIKKVNNSIATLEDANGKTLRNVPCVVVLVDDSSKYNVTAQNNTSVTLEDENNKVIHAPAKVVLATSTDFTLVKVNNSTATLQDGSGNIIRNVPCVSMLADKNYTLSKVNNSTAVLTDDNSQTIRDVPCIVVLAKQSGAITVIVGPAPAPLSLPDAVAGSLRYVKAYGGTIQGVPDGYTMLDSVSNRTSTTCDVNTGIYVNVDDVEIEIQASARPGSWYIFQSQKTQSAVIWGISGANSGSKISFNWGGLVLQSNISRTSGNTYYVKATAKNGNATLYVKDITNNVEDTVTDTYDYGSGPTSWFGIFGTERNPSLAVGNAVYFAKMSVGGKQVLDAIPAQRQSDSVNGFYNKINGQFLIPEEPTALNAGTPVVPTPTAPIDITCNNGVLKLRHQSGLPLGYTLLNRVRPLSPVEIPYKPNYNTEIECTFYKHASASQWLYKADSDSAGTTNFTAYAGGYWRFDATGVNIGTISIATHTSIHNKDGVILDGVKYNYNAVPESFTSVTNLAVGSGAGSGGGTSIGQLKIRENGVLLMHYRACQRDSDNAYGLYDIINDTFLTFEVNSASSSVVADPVGVYPVGKIETIEDTIGNTATAEMLLKVGDYQDVQSIIDGTVNRQLGVFILDGTERWAYSAGYSDTETNACFYIPTGSSTIPILPQTGTSVECLCSHFRWVSRNDIYNNKTPIVGAITGATGEQRIGVSITLRVPLSIANTSATDFKQWLADQYAAGTPVIVVYPLVEPTTESVTGQTLQVAQGDNTLSIIQASMPGLELEAEYTKQG